MRERERDKGEEEKDRKETLDDCRKKNNKEKRIIGGKCKYALADTLEKYTRSYIYRTHAYVYLT